MVGEEGRSARAGPWCRRHRCSRPDPSLARPALARCWATQPGVGPQLFCSPILRSAPPASWPLRAWPTKRSGDGNAPGLRAQAAVVAPKRLARASSTACARRCGRPAAMGATSVALVVLCVGGCAAPPRGRGGGSSSPWRAEYRWGRFSEALLILGGAPIWGGRVASRCACDAIPFGQ